MKTQLILALTLSVLAAQSFAADGFDRTGSAAAINRYDAALAADDHDQAAPDTIAAGSHDRTDSARTD
ncbi:hypothetical protein [Pseudomonas sp. SMN5]|uniref:hypothetical protein n=1 Tax=Pseudomonas sp. SMN5 TaxID=3390198 RepID=UPI003F82C9FF